PCLRHHRAGERRQARTCPHAGEFARLDRRRHVRCGGDYVSLMEFNVAERLTEKAIGELVDQFYVKVRADAELGPVFDRAISDWGPHLATMRNFWSSVMLTSGRYKGNPVAVHRRVAGIEFE